MTTLTVTGLINNLNYSFKVEARNVVGFGQISPAVVILSARIPDTPASLFNNPAITQAGLIALQWTAGYDGGTPITSYRLSYDQSTGIWVELASGLTNLQYTASNIVPGNTYAF